MIARNPVLPAVDPEDLLELVNQAFDLAQQAARGAAEFFAGSHNDVLKKVSSCERDLDRVDREFDDRLAPALAGTKEAKRIAELLAGLKLVIDLERIGDLLLSCVTTADAISPKIEQDEINDFIKMCSLIEQMLAGVHDAWRTRNLEEALQSMRADAELDRLRNLLVMRQLTTSSPSASHGIHVVGIAQGLERAGDHVRNLAEEIAHLCTGRSLRHARRASEKPDEVRYIERMRRQYKKP